MAKGLFLASRHAYKLVLSPSFCTTCLLLLLFSFFPLDKKLSRRVVDVGAAVCHHLPLCLLFRRRASREWQLRA
ncbi:hypothetical protein NC652_038875 [Populus alba x Populus x berolinensis]|nr:hypothetical protein NC652_038875 [Populus alba x Populus x berolinensis]